MLTSDLFLGNSFPTRLLGISFTKLFAHKLKPWLKYVCSFRVTDTFYSNLCGTGQYAAKTNGLQK